MIKFGYKNRFNGPFRALCALAIGLVMVVRPADAMSIVVKVVAAFLLASGVVSLLQGLKNKNNGALPLMSFNALVDVLLGTFLFVFPGFVAKFIIYLIGFVLLAFGVLQLTGLISARKAVQIGVGAYVIPSLVTLAGCFILFNPFAESVMSLIAGVAFLIYGVSELYSSWKMRKAINVDDTTVDEQ